MTTQILKYKVIKTEIQYKKYCKILKELVFSSKKTKSIEEEIELLTLLVEKWQEISWRLPQMTPIEILKFFMNEHKMQAKDLVDLLGISKGYVSDILNYKKSLSKEVIRKLAEKFNLKQEALNRPYELLQPVNLKTPPKKRKVKVA